MNTLRALLLATLILGGFVSQEADAQPTFDLEVDVVMDTVLYEGFDEVAEGSRRYKLYAVLPEDALMLGISADDASDPVIPGFGYTADCGCYNWVNPLIPGSESYHAGYNINPAYLSAFPSLQYDTWWTTHLSQQTSTTTPIPLPTFYPGYNSCSDIVDQGGLLVTGADPIHSTVTNSRALIGQITTCETFSFQVCVTMQDGGVGGEVITKCTDGPVTVSDLCLPMMNPEYSILETIDCFGDEASMEVLPANPGLAFNPTVEYSLYQFDGTDTTIVQQQYGNPIFSGIEEGNYFVALLDTARTVAFSSNTCRDTTEVFAFTSPAEIELEATLTADNICGDQDLATICFTVDGGTGDITTEATHSLGFAIPPNAEDCFGPLECFGGDGAYTVVATDAEGCVKDTTIVVSCPEPLGFNAGATEVSCTGYSDATLSAAASGGTGTVVFEVPEINVVIEFDGSIDFEQDSLPSGTYTFTITDDNGCTYTEPLTIEEPDGLDVEYALSDVACAGDCNGLILADINGGELPYIIAVSDLDGVAANPGQLCPGTYVHITEDGNECLVTDTLTIVGPDTISFTFNVSNVPCSGGSSGQVCLDSLEGGTGPLTAQLVPLPTGSQDGNCFNVPAGNYEVLVQDSVGCTSEFFEALVEEPASIDIIPSITPISCTGSNDGTLVVNALGGSGDLELISPFIFSALPDTLTGLGADSLMLVVADTLGCIDSLQVTIPEPDPVVLEVLTTVFPDCGGDCTGGIEVSLAGGTGVLTLFDGYLSDSTNVTPSGLVNLCADTYALFLSDENGCLDSVTVDIVEPDPLLFDITVQDVTCTGMADGVAIIGTIGGSGPTAWEFVGGAVDVLNLFEGEYLVSAADTAGCTADSSFTVEADIVTDMVVEVFSTPVTCWQTSDGTVTAAVTGGQLPIQYSWSDAANQTTATAIGLPEDVYSVTVTDNIGCTLGFLATVDPTEDCLFIADALTPNGDGINDRWVVGGLEFYPQSEVEVFNRWGQLIFRSKPGTTWWDGTYNGALLPASDYYYVISVEPGSTPITGTVTIKY